MAILEKIRPEGKILGIDWNPDTLKNPRYGNRIILVCDNFSNLKNIVEKLNFKPVSGILLDLGISSWHLQESKKGFSFQRNEPLDMRYNAEAQDLTAEIIVNEWPETEIEKILKEYGEERFAGGIAKEITRTRKVKPIKNTFDLTEIIKRATPAWYQHKKIHFATRVFQALRIAVNDELDNLKKVLPQTIDILEKEGRLVIISFHSLEDRIAKSFLRENSKFLKENSKKGHFKILTKKPVRPTEEEIKINPRARSARLRAAQFLQAL